MVTLMGNALWQLIKQSDTISKLVLLILLGLSIACWAVFFYKMSLIRAKRRSLEEALARLKLINSMDQLLELVGQLQGTLPGYYIAKNLAYLKSLLEVNQERGVAMLTDRQWESIQETMAQTIDEAVHEEEMGMALLSTSVTVSPLLGLFGTVWGLVHAFIRISEKQTADIVTVAPGIAEALITTLAGLVVAVPALVMFNYLMAQIRALEAQLVRVADKMSSIFQKLFVSSYTS